jgi:RecB family exonuclease
VITSYELPDVAFSVRPSGVVLRASGERAEEVRRKTVSCSTTSSLAKCPAGWFLDFYFRAGQFEDALGASTIGSDVHWIFEEFYALPAEERILANLIKFRDKRVAEFVYESDEVRERARTGMTYGMMGIFLIEDPTKIVVHSIEHEIVLNFRGTPFKGMIDRMRYDEDGNLIIDDYKSGNQHFKPEWALDNELQQATYAIMTAEETGIAPVAANLLYTKIVSDVVLALAFDVAEGRRTREEALALIPLGDVVPKAKPVPLTPEVFAKAEQRLAAAWEQHDRFISTREFPVGRKTPLCQFCPAVKVCPVGAS